MADIIFNHTLPDETYNNTGHPFNGINKRLLYSMGMLYHTEEVHNLNPQSIDEYIAFISTHLTEAKLKYAEILDETMENHIKIGLKRFLAKINKTDIEINTITQEE